MDTDSPIVGNAHWALRIALASVFLYHGLSKFFVMGIGMDGFGSMVGSSFVAFLVALAETCGGLFVLIGPFTHDLVTRLGGLAIVPVMLGAIAMVHWGQWSFAASETHQMGGMEFQVVLILIGLYFALVGNQTVAGGGSGSSASSGAGAGHSAGAGETSV